MTPESTLLALLVGALAWYGQSRRTTAGRRLAGRRPAPLVTPAPAPAPATRPLAATASAEAGTSLPPEGGSARSFPDGSPPDPDYPIKGNANSMLFHSPTSPYYKRTRAEVWFATADDARAAGFTEWTPRRRDNHDRR